jgi:hypothetical protein
MKPYFINLLNALVYIVFGSWGYLSSGTPSVTALIPVLAGIILVCITPGFKQGNRVLAHIAVVLTFAMLMALLKPLTGTIGRSDKSGIARVIIMMFSSLVAMIFFIKSFVDARRLS